MSDDAELVRAVRARLRRLIDESGGGVSNVINNNVGSSGETVPARTLKERMLSDDGVDDKDYKVRIARRDVKDNEGNVIGWNKDVHRYVEQAKKRKIRAGMTPFEDV